MKIAIQPDDYTASNAMLLSDASSPRWAAHLQRAGHTVHWVDVYRSDILDQVKGCHGFMWRWAHFGGMYQIAQRLLPVLERELGLVVYPDQNTCWHYDDKIAQRYLLDAAGIPIPRTWVWFERMSAMEWLQTASYPLVMKLANGAGSTNVQLVRTLSEAADWVARLFGSGVADLTKLSPPLPANWRRRVRAALRALITGRLGIPTAHPWPLHRGYVLFQEFLPNNQFDTRVTVIGNRAFAFRRFNRANDFRASGSGHIDYDNAHISNKMLRLAFLVANKLRTQSIAIDGLWRGDEAVIGEISYTYASWAVHACPGYWALDGEPADGQLHWVDGHMWPEEAQAEDFLARLRGRQRDQK